MQLSATLVKGKARIKFDAPRVSHAAPTDQNVPLHDGDVITSAFLDSFPAHGEPKNYDFFSFFLEFLVFFLEFLSIFVIRFPPKKCKLFILMMMFKKFLCNNTFIRCKPHDFCRIRAKILM